MTIAENVHDLIVPADAASILLTLSIEYGTDCTRQVDREKFDLTTGAYGAYIDGASGFPMYEDDPRLFIGTHDGEILIDRTKGHATTGMKLYAGTDMEEAKRIAVMAYGILFTHGDATR